MGYDTMSNNEILKIENLKKNISNLESESSNLQNRLEELKNTKIQ